MQEKLMIFSIIMLVSLTVGAASAQEIGLATFQESAQIIVDKSISQNVTASITLHSTSIQEIRIPAELEQEIRENKKIRAVIVTNQDQCVLGVVDESCIMINVERDHTDKGIIEIQDSSKAIGDKYIDKINDVFKTDAKLHSVFVHSDDQSNKALETSGLISGRGAISVIYTMSMEDTNSMYEKISALLLPKVIRESGGFYEVAKELSMMENSKMTFSIIPIDTGSLMQLKLSVDYPGKAEGLTQINPFEFLNVDEMVRSEYFSNGFYPLNSLIQLVILSQEDTFVSNINGNIVPTQIIDNEKIPTDITEQGWVFDPENGQRIQGMYIFGKENSINKEDLRFTLGGEGLENPKLKPVKDDSTIIVIIITVVAVAAAIYYLKGYRK